jgi:hypothetical protein
MSDMFVNAPVLLWQMGKVGSTSIWDALDKAGLCPIQLHVLATERLDAVAREYEERGFSVPGHLEDARRVQSLVADPNQKLRVISLVRDPVARNLSGLFETWDVYPPSFDEGDNLAGLAEWFVMNFDYAVLKWFEDEIESKLGISVYDYEFDRVRRQLVIETDRARILVLRSEDTQESKKRSLEDFLQVSGIEIGFSNVSDSKPKADLWKRMRRSAKVSSILANLVYESRLVQHFYSAAEIRALREEWKPSRDGIYFEPALAME